MILQIEADVNRLRPPEASCGLLRACDYSTAARNKACEIFWTLGANQVGKAAIAGWRDLLAPAVRDKAIAIWPFDGDHPAIFEAGGIVVAFGILGMRERMEQIWVPSKLPAAREMVTAHLPPGDSMASS